MARIEYTYPYPVLRPPYAPRQGLSLLPLHRRRGRWSPFRRGDAWRLSTGRSTAPLFRRRYSVQVPDRTFRSAKTR